MGNVKQPFGVQAARFSLYAPIVALVIGTLTMGNRGEPGVAMTIGAINVGLIVLGFLLGIVALISMRRYGREGILGRAIAGVLFNGVLIAAMVGFVLPLIFAGRDRAKIVGHWQFHSTGNGNAVPKDFVFKSDGTFQIDGTLKSGDVSFGGHWIMTDYRAIGLTVDHIEKGDPPAVGTKVLLGTINSIDDRQMVLRTNDGTESYDRQP